MNLNKELVEEFKRLKEKILNGALEAETNYDVLKDVETPYLVLVSQDGITNAPLLFPSIMSSLQVLYKKSAFYKESRLISLLEKIIHSILKLIEELISINQLFLLLKASKGKARKVRIRISQAHMIINIILENLFIKDWLKTKPKKTDITYLGFSRPDTPYIHDPLGQPNTTQGYIKMTAKKTPIHVEDNGKKEWIVKAQTLIDTLLYVKKATTNIDSMCKAYSKLCEYIENIDSKVKIYKEVNGFLIMYEEHKLEYPMLELTSATTFQSFVVTYNCYLRTHTRKERKI